MIYLDNSATTKIYEDALNIYHKYSIENYFNSAAPYNAAGLIFSDINRARDKIAAGLNVPPANIIFTSGGTESNNIAIQGFLKNKKRGRIVCGGGEHASVYNIFKSFENGCFDIVFAPLDKFGAVDLEKFFPLITPDTVLVSVMHVSNETGAITDIEKIVKGVKAISPDCAVHSDGVQAYGKMKIDIKKLGCDLYSVSAHKHHGPKGAGALYIAQHIKLSPLFFGGGQENNLRSGTHNAAGIMAYGEAAARINSRLETNFAHNQVLKERFWNTLSGEVVDIVLNSESISSGVPNILSISIKSVPAEVLVTILEMKGIIVDTGSACSSKKGHLRIHQAMNMSKEYSSGTLRFSFSEFNTLEEIDIAVNELIKAIKELRKVCKK